MLRWNDTDQVPFWYTELLEIIPKKGKKANFPSILITILLEKLKWIDLNTISPGFNNNMSHSVIRLQSTRDDEDDEDNEKEILKILSGISSDISFPCKLPEYFLYRTIRLLLDVFLENSLIDKSTANQCIASMEKQHYDEIKSTTEMYWYDLQLFFDILSEQAMLLTTHSPEEPNQTIVMEAVNGFIQKYTKRS